MSRLPHSQPSARSRSIVATVIRKHAPRALLGGLIVSFAPAALRAQESAAPAGRAPQIETEESRVVTEGPAASAPMQYHGSIPSNPIDYGPFARPSSMSSHGPKVRDLVLKIRQTEPDNPHRDPLLEELRSLLSEEFEKNHQSLEQQIEAAAQKLESLKQLHQKRFDHREAIVKRESERLLGEPDPLQWQPPVGMSIPPSSPSPGRPNFGRNPFAGPGTVPLMPPSPFNRPPTAPNSPFPPTPPSAPGFHDPFGPGPNDSDRYPGTRVEHDIELRDDQSGPDRMLGELFQIARRALTTQRDLETAKQELLARMKYLGGRNLPPSELGKVDRLQIQLDLDREQLRAMSTMQELELKSLESQFRQTREQLLMVEAGFKAGKTSQQELAKLRVELSKAEQELGRARLQLQQLEKAIERVGPIQSEASQGDAEADASTE